MGRSDQCRNEGATVRWHARRRDLLFELLDSVSPALAIDRGRIHLTGQSLGGYRIFFMVISYGHEEAGPVRNCYSRLWWRRSDGGKQVSRRSHVGVSWHRGSGGTHTVTCRPLSCSNISVTNSPENAPVGLAGAPLDSLSIRLTGLRASSSWPCLISPLCAQSSIRSVALFTESLAKRRRGMLATQRRRPGRAGH
jgi:hypothetical protein